MAENKHIWCRYTCYSCMARNHTVLITLLKYTTKLKFITPKILDYLLNSACLISLSETKTSTGVYDLCSWWELWNYMKYFVSIVLKMSYISSQQVVMIFGELRCHSVQGLFSWYGNRVKFCDFKTIISAIRLTIWRYKATTNYGFTNRQNLSFKIISNFVFLLRYESWHSVSIINNIIIFFHKFSRRSFGDEYTFVITLFRVKGIKGTLPTRKETIHVLTMGFNFLIFLWGRGEGGGRLCYSYNLYTTL